MAQSRTEIKPGRFGASMRRDAWWVELVPVIVVLGSFGIYATWRQTFHVLGVDGEWLQEEAATTARAARHTLGLKVTAKDLEGLRG